MRGWILDAYRWNNQLALWIKTTTGDVRVLRSYQCSILVQDTPRARTVLRYAQYTTVEKPTVYGGSVPVLTVHVPKLEYYEQTVREFEQLLRYRVPLFDADITPEQRFFYEQNIYPGCLVKITQETIERLPEQTRPPLRSIELRIVLEPGSERIKAITLGNRLFIGEHSLPSFATAFQTEDPDIIICERAFSRVALLDKKLREHAIPSPLHRFDDMPVRNKGGKSFFSYGSVRYQDFAVHLHGRILVDTATMVGSSDPDCILELAELSSLRLQTVAARSYGATFQASLIRELVQEGVAIPYKEKPIERPFSMREFLAADRTGQILDPQVGFHQNVAEIDFTSMYPFLIHRYNMSAETIIPATPCDEQAPGIHVHIKQGTAGIVPRAIKPFLERRLFYKRNPSPVHALRAAALKMVLVTSYGYLRFREFKLGIPSSHMAIGAYARETLLHGVEEARTEGFTVLHGIVDSLYLARPAIEDAHVTALCQNLEKTTGLPISYEGIFAWIVFLPSIRDSRRPVPMRYYGVFRTGELKMRGIMARKRSTPQIVKEFQKKCLRRFAQHHDHAGILSELHWCAEELQRATERVSYAPMHELLVRIRISTNRYKIRNAQSRVLAALRAKNIVISPGQSVSVMWTARGPEPTEYTTAQRNVAHYRELLSRSLYELVQPLGVTKETLCRLQHGQTVLAQWLEPTKLSIPNYNTLNLNVKISSAATK